jgi:hypothetical protein
VLCALIQIVNELRSSHPRILFKYISLSLSSSMQLHIQPSSHPGIEVFHEQGNLITVDWQRLDTYEVQQYEDCRRLRQILKRNPSPLHSAGVKSRVFVAIAALCTPFCRKMNSRRPCVRYSCLGISSKFQATIEGNIQLGLSRPPLLCLLLRIFHLTCIDHSPQYIRQLPRAPNI